jgi:hypothetical protein
LRRICAARLPERLHRPLYVDRRHSIARGDLIVPPCRERGAAPAVADQAEQETLDALLKKLIAGL